MVEGISGMSGTGPIGDPHSKNADRFKDVAGQLHKALDELHMHPGDPNASASAFNALQTLKSMKGDFDPVSQQGQIINNLGSYNLFSDSCDTEEGLQTFSKTEKGKLSIEAASGMLSSYGY